MALFRRRRLSSVQIIVLFYLSSVLISTGLLYIPYFHQPGVELSFTDALFTAVSAISVTGLTVVSTADTFNSWGVLVLSVIIQFGGIGIMTLGTFFWILLGRKIGLAQRQWIAIDQNRSTLSGLVALMQAVLEMTLIIEAIGTLVLGSYFMFTGYKAAWNEAFYYGFFASVSAFTNAGFDIFGDSLMQFKDDYFIQLVNMVLLILGAVGFPVLIEVKEYFKQRHLKQRYHFSLYTKLTTSTFFGLVLSGALMFYLFEFKHFLADQSWHAKLFHSLFYSVTTRSGGLVTIDISQLTEPTLLSLCILMFIGASPSSVGGGIRTTTFIVMILATIAYMRGRSEVKVFRRQLYQEDITKAFIVFIVAMHLVAGATLVLMAIEPFSMMEIFFEVSSAFGTTGLSMGITAELSTLGKYILMFLMFIGRIGIVHVLFLLKNEKPLGYQYPKERMIIG